MKSLLERTVGDQRVDVLAEIAKSYGETNFALCFYFASEAHRQANIVSDTFRIVRTGRIKAQAYRRIDKIDSAIYKFNDVLIIAKRLNYKSELTNILNGLGVSYVLKAKYDDALRCHFESLSLREYDRDPDEIGEALINIGLVYYKLQDYNEALSHYLRALSMSHQNKLLH